MNSAARYVVVLLLGVLVGAEGASRWKAPRDANECFPWSRWISEKPITVESGPMEFSGKVMILGCKAELERLSDASMATLSRAVEAFVVREHMSTLFKRDEPAWRVRAAHALNAALGDAVITDVSFHFSMSEDVG